MNSVTIELPWPDKALSPNARVHFHALAAAKRDAKSAAHVLALAAGVKYLQIAGHPILTWRFMPPDRRRRDLDNLIASMKASADGIAMALLIDDSRFEMRYPPISETRKGGAVIVTIQDSGT